MTLPETMHGVLAIHEGQTDTAMVRGQQVAKRAALRLAVRC